MIVADPDHQLASFGDFFRGPAQGAAAVKNGHLEIDLPQVFAVRALCLQDVLDLEVGLFESVFRTGLGGSEAPGIRGLRLGDVPRQRSRTGQQGVGRIWLNRGEGGGRGIGGGCGTRLATCDDDRLGHVETAEKSGERGSGEQQPWVGTLHRASGGAAVRSRGGRVAQRSEFQGLGRGRQLRGFRGQGCGLSGGRQRSHEFKVRAVLLGNRWQVAHLGRGRRGWHE